VRAESLAAHFHLGFAIVDIDDDAFEAERAEDDAVADDTMRGGPASGSGTGASVLAILVHERIDGGPRVAAHAACIARGRCVATFRVACSAARPSVSSRSATTASISARASRIRSSSFSFSAA
jgi:hypothetical protein